MKYWIFIIIVLILSCSENTGPNSPSSPEDLVITQLTPTSIRLNWLDNSNNEDGFKIDKKINSENWIEDFVILNLNTAEYVDNTIEPNNMYHYRICSYKGNEQSASIEDSIYASFQGPSDFELTELSFTSVELTWIDEIDFEDGFKIDRKVYNDPWEIEYATLGANTTQYIDENALPCYEIKYKLYAYFDDVVSQSVYDSITLKPTILDLFNSNGVNEAYRIKVMNDKAYVISENQLSILDVSNPMNINILGSCSISFSDEYTELGIKDNFIYVSNNNFEIYEIINNTPIFATCLYPYVYGSKNICFYQSYLIHSYWGGGLLFHDISDPYNAIYINQINYNEVRDLDIYDHFLIFTHDQYIYIQDLDLLPNVNPTNIYTSSFYDVSKLAIKNDILCAYMARLYLFSLIDPYNPQITETIYPEVTSPSEIVTYNDLLVSLSVFGIEVINISDPINPFISIEYFEFGNIGPIWDIDIYNGYGYLASDDGIYIIKI